MCWCACMHAHACVCVCVCVKEREEGGERENYLAVISSTAPTGYPRSIRSGTVTPNSITVHWEEVDCLDRNGAITGYIARALSNGREEGTASVGGDDREATISGLTPSTQYIVQVAAVNSAGTGPYSPIARLHNTRVEMHTVK